MTIGQRIRELRKKHKMTLKEFSGIIGMSESAVSTIENDKCVPLADVIVAICQRFEVSADYLLLGRSVVGGDVIHSHNTDSPIINESESLNKLLCILENDRLELNKHIERAYESQREVVEAKNETILIQTEFLKYLDAKRGKQ